MVYDRAMANDEFARMKNVAADISGHLGGLDVEVELSYVDRKWYRKVPTGKVLINGADLLKSLETFTPREQQERP
jgi:hypothetical protein